LKITINRGLPSKKMLAKCVIALSICVSATKKITADSIAASHVIIGYFNKLTLGFYSSTLNATIKSLTVWTIFALSALYVGESLKSFIGLFQESFQTHSTFSKSWGGT